MIERNFPTIAIAEVFKDDFLGVNLTVAIEIVAEIGGKDREAVFLRILSYYSEQSRLIKTNRHYIRINIGHSTADFASGNFSGSIGI